MRMELIAFSAAQPTPQQPSDASSEVNSAGWGTLLWVSVIAVVFFILVAAAGVSLVGSRRRMRE
jgi:signal transduction histidine kinase